MPYNPFSVPEFINFHMLWSLNVVTCIVIRAAAFFVCVYCTLFEYDKFRTRFNFEVQHPRCVYQYNLRYVRVVKTQLKIYL